MQLYSVKIISLFFIDSFALSSVPKILHTSLAILLKYFSVGGNAN